MNKILLRHYPIGASSGGQAPRGAASYRKWVTALWAALVISGLGQAARAAPGDLDPSFDADGRVLTHFGAIDGDAPGSSDFARVVAVQPDGKLIVAGNSGAAGFGPSNVALARYNADGALDSIFGNGGRVLTDFGAGRFVDSAVIAPDGKILVAGPTFTFPPEFPTVVFLGRYEPDGSLDNSFGSTGRLFIDVSAVVDFFVPTTYLQPDGKLVVAGARSELLSNFDSDFSLARYNADGSLDASFGSGGRVITDFTEDPNDPRQDGVGVVIRQPDGKLVAAGNSLRSGSGVLEFALARYNLDGSLDGSFGSDGRVVTDFDGRFGVDFGPIVLVVQPGGKLIVGFRLLEGGVSTTFLTRFNADGSVDAAFGSSGFVVVSGVSGFRSFGLRIAQADGKLVVATVAEASPGSSSLVTLVTLVRYNGDGSLDTSFGSGGRVRTSFDGRLLTSTASPSGLVMQPDGKLVVVGTSDAGGDADFALARYLVTNERPKQPPRCGGRRATMLGTRGNDMLRGTLFGRDVILGLGGNDTIRGLGGGDVICGGRGNDVLIGGDDSDRLFGEAGNDRLFGDLGLSSVDGDDALFGGPGRDTLVGDDGSDLLFGEAGNDRLFGDQGADTLDGGIGRDRCRDRFGQNTFDGCDTGAARRPPEPPRDPIPSLCNTPGCQQPATASFGHKERR